MGLLDGGINLQDPQQMGLLSAAAGMFNASGPSLMPHSLGQTLGQGLLGYTQGNKDALAMQREALQTQGLKQQLATGALKLKALQDMAGTDGSPMIAETGGQPAIPAPKATQFPLGSGYTGMAPPQPGDDQQAIEPTKALTANGSRYMNGMRQLALIDGKLDTAYNIYKDGITGFGRDVNKMYVMPDGSQNFVADPTKGLGFDPSTNTVSVLPGFAKANADIKGAETGAQKKAEAAYTLLPLGYKTSDSRPIGGTVLEYLGSQEGTQGGSAPPAPAPQIPPGYEKFIQDRANALSKITDPNERQSFIKAAYGNIAFMPAAQRGQLKAVWDGIVNGQNQQPPQAQQPQQMPFGQVNTFGQRPVLQSDEEAKAIADAQDVKKAADLAGVKQATDPKITYATDAAKNLQTKAEVLGAQLNESQELLKRIQQSRDALKAFQAGGGMEQKVHLAQIAQGLGAPKSIIDGIAGGSLSAAQEFQKYAAQEALATMQQALANETGKGSQGNRLSMQLFIKNNPNIDTDPNAIEKIFNFQTQLHNQLLDKHDFLTRYATDQNTAKDPLIFDNAWAHRQIDKGYVTPKLVSGEAKGVVNDATQNQPVQPPLKAINTLKLNPNLREQFDAKYGAGAAAKVLGK